MEHSDRPSCPSSEGAPSFLDLPQAVLREVLSHSPDIATANALLNTCDALCRVRRDPAAAALLLLRCPCQNYKAALGSCNACEGGTAAVVQQVLQRVQATPDGGGPLAAPAPLLQAMLYSACAAGDEPHVRALLAMQSQPDASAEGSRALINALAHGPHLAVAAALLEAGADASDQDMQIIDWAAQRPASHRHRQALYLLLQHCPAPARAGAAALAVRSAILGGCQEALERLLPVGNAAGVDWLVAVLLAARTGDAGVLRVLLDHHAPAELILSTSLEYAAAGSHIACVQLLVDRGAEANRRTRGVMSEELLVKALLWVAAGAGPVAEADWRDAVDAALQRHGVGVGQLPLGVSDNEASDDEASDGQTSDGDETSAGDRACDGDEAG